MTTQDCYRILGVSPGTAWEEIRRRYRTLARQYHPDHNPDDPGAAAHFRRLAAAYEVIREARARPRRPSQKYLRPRVTVKEEELFEEFFGITRTDAALCQSPGPDFRYDLLLPFVDAILGTETVIQVSRSQNCRLCMGSGAAPGSGLQDCPDCQGRGRRFRGPGLLRFGPLCERCRGRGKVIARVCPHCDGEGYLQKVRQYHLKIPPGTEDGTRLRLPGEGGAGFRNGPPGDLEVVISVAPHAFFTRVGNDLYCEVEVSFAQAALGGPILIPTLEAHQTLNLPRGTQSGQVFRFLGAGAPGGPQRPRGDQVVKVVVTTPEDLRPGQKEILEELARLERDQRTVAVHEQVYPTG
jgi:molecular chaperone DnaJ